MRHGNERRGLGKPYDFEFDFPTATGVVCTELVCRGFHTRGPIAFAFTKRLGRFTLTGDDIMDAALGNGAAGAGPPGAPFAVPVLALTRAGAAAALRGPEAHAGCLRIRGGWRPAEPAPRASRS
jgi:hypothetical protein